MTYRKSAYDAISQDLSEAIRNVTDSFMTVLGTKTKVLRIQRSEPDVLGNYTETLTSGFIDNVLITHPLGDVQIYLSDSGVGDVVSDGLDLWELLPFIMRIPFSGTYADTAMGIKKGDLIIDFLYDHTSGAIPLIFEVTKIRGGFMSKHMTNKKYELALVRGELSEDVQTVIDTFITSL